MVKTTTGTIYVSSDGKEFIDRLDCIQHENELKAFDNVKYYKVRHDLINAESGEYENCTYFAISEPKIKGAYYHGLDALEEYCLINYAGKQDKSLFYTDIYYDCTIRRYTKPLSVMKDEFFSANTNYNEKIYFSDTPIIQFEEKGIKQLTYSFFKNR